MLVPLIAPDKPWSEIIKNITKNPIYDEFVVFDEPDGEDIEIMEDFEKEKEFFDEVFQEKSRTLSKALQDFVLINKLKELCFSDNK